MPQPPSKTDRLNERMRRYASVERLMLMRNCGYGGAAACLIVLVGLTQVGAKDMALRVSVFSASLALPMWLLLGGIYELYIFLGKQSYPHLRTKFSANFIGLIALTAGFGSVGAAGGVIWFLIPEAAWVFGAAVLVAVILAAIFNVFLARWWFGADGPERPDNRSGDANV